MPVHLSTRTGLAIPKEADGADPHPDRKGDVNGGKKVAESRQGTVQLRSGRWSWLVRERNSGAAVVFHHRDRPMDELRTWIPEGELSVARATELALDPVERLWLDADGILWSIRTDFPAGWARAEEDDARTIRLIFRYHGLQKVFPVPADTRLGELTHSELTRLLRST